MKKATVQFAALFAIVAMTTACGTETTTTLPRAFSASMNSEKPSKSSRCCLPSPVM